MDRRTPLTPEQLADLAAQGKAMAAKSPFVDPCVVAESKRLLRARGEQWAGSVLMRDLSTRRSQISADYPWFHDGEMETLILAEQAELVQLWNNINNPTGTEGDLA